MKQLFTIGYEGSSVQDLVQTLLNVGIEVLADVRELPLSRKKGLSKNALSVLLNEAGIEYRHFKKLGDPKTGRDAAKSGDLATFERVFTKHLGTSEAQDALENLLLVAENKKTCMLCFERNPKNCHRSFIADEALEAGFLVLNLFADHPEKYLTNEFKIPRHNSRKSLAAAE